MTEKNKPHYALSDIRTCVAAQGISAFTRTAQIGFAEMDLSPDEAVQVVLSLNRSMFYKSMTTHTDHRVWQDVYHASCHNGKTAYIKLTLRDGTVVIQFKEK